MRVLVTGGRYYDDWESVKTALDGLREKHGRLTVIQGGAMGADALAVRWCSEQPSCHLINEPAQWLDLETPPVVLRQRANGSVYNAAAGGVRNQRMLDEHKPDLVLAFEGNKGTRDMIRRAESAGVPVVRCPRSK